ncbi:hypothetical protein ACFW84_03715 [Streptomyces anulatus]|uniref:hypothetical protein n=1 Tax=Streptomyces anulatus TaxID=1892 RepID=UPI0036B8A4FC
MTLNPGLKVIGWKDEKLDEILRSIVCHLHELLAFEAQYAEAYEYIQRQDEALEGEAAKEFPIGRPASAD